MFVRRLRPDCGRTQYSSRRIVLVSLILCLHVIICPPLWRYIADIGVWDLPVLAKKITTCVVYNLWPTITKRLTASFSFIFGRYIYGQYNCNRRFGATNNYSAAMMMMTMMMMLLWYRPEQILHVDMVMNWRVFPSFVPGFVPATLSYFTSATVHSRLATIALKQPGVLHWITAFTKSQSNGEITCFLVLMWTFFIFVIAKFQQQR